MAMYTFRCPHCDEGNEADVRSVDTRTLPGWRWTIEMPDRCAGCAAPFSDDQREQIVDEILDDLWTGRARKEI